VQRLTFHRYLEGYVRRLSLSDTNSIAKLVKEVPDNHRLRDPLFLYALSTGKVDLLVRVADRCPSCSVYTELAGKYTWEQMVKALKDKDIFLGGNFHKTYRNFVSKHNMPETMSNKKELMHKRIRELQDEKNISNYRIYTDLKLNPSNANFFLKNGDVRKVSLSIARKMVTYLEAAQQKSKETVQLLS